MTGVSVQQRIAEITREAGVPVRYIDDVDDPVEDSGFVTLRVYAEGELAEVLVLTSSNFYECLARVIASTMPPSDRVH